MKRFLLIPFWLILSYLHIIAQPNPEDFVKADKAVKLLNHNEVMKAIGYPQEAKDAKASGEVVLRVEFDEKGNYVRHIVKKYPHPTLLKAVEIQIEAIKATPATLERKPIRFWLNVPFKFNLMGADPVEVLNFDEVRAMIGYPEKAEKKGLHGSVQVGVLTDIKGIVTEYKILGSSDKIFTQAVEKYIKLLKFKPMTKDGVPCTIRSTVIFDF